jgi:hypothetical protein
MFKMKLNNDIFYERRDLHIFVEEDPVEGGFNKECLSGCKEGDKNHANHGEGQFEPIGLNEFEESAIERHLETKSQ